MLQEPVHLFSLNISCLLMHPITSLLHFNYSGEVQRQIKLRVINHLEYCSGNVVIIFDEVQKIAPGALESLLPGLDDKASLSVNGGPDVSTANAIFLFISDIGADKTTNLLLMYGERELIPHYVLRSEVKDSLDQQWARLSFGRSIKDIIPFLPMEKKHLEDVFRLKMAEMERQSRGVYWGNLLVDDTVIDHLSGPKFVKYRVHTASFATPSDGDNLTKKPETFTRTKTLAVLGARALENAGDVLFVLHCAAPYCALSIYIPTYRHLASADKVIFLSAGPIHDLESLLQRHMQPWRPRKSSMHSTC